MKTMRSSIGLLGLLVLGSCSQHEDLKMTALFNQKDLTGWKGKGYVVENGAITCTKQGRNLITEKTYSNYVLDFEFLLTPGANNGLGIHYPGYGDGAYTGMEIQVLDNTAKQYKNLKDYQFHGGIYTLAAARKRGLKPVGEWNHQRVTVDNSMVNVVLNGKRILKANLDRLSAKHPKHVGVKRRSGHIAWLGHGEKVSFRNIMIAEIAPGAKGNKMEDEGFVKIFDGVSLKGWKHEEGIRNWAAVDGILKHNGKPGPTKDLWTEKSYRDFTMVFDWRWSGRGEKKKQPVVLPDGTSKDMVEIEELDSGVYLRGSSKSQVNLWNWTVGSGEVYGYRTDPKMPPEVKAAVTPKEKADKPIGEWNTMVITMKGDRLTVQLNGKTVIEGAQLPGVPAEGAIGLQHHGQAIDFANVWIKEL